MNHRAQRTQGITQKPIHLAKAKRYEFALAFYWLPGGWLVAFGLLAWRMKKEKVCAAAGSDQNSAAR